MSATRRSIVSSPLVGEDKGGGSRETHPVGGGPPPAFPPPAPPPTPTRPHKGGGSAGDASSFDSTQSTSALAGLRVVELARVLAGPTTGQTLADLGADVVKVESPEGDETRRWGPPFIDTEGEQSAAYFHSCNRGKRSVVADFGTERGREIVRRLAARSDVLIENFKVEDSPSSASTTSRFVTSTRASSIAR